MVNYPRGSGRSLPGKIQKPRDYVSGRTSAKVMKDKSLNPDEQVLQILFYRDVSSALYQFPFLKILHHIPNGGYRTSAEAKILRGSGVLSGVCDNFLPVPRGGYMGWYGELKKRYGDGPTENQFDFMRDTRAQGYWSDWHRGNSALFDDLMRYLALPPDARDNPEFMQSELLTEKEWNGK